MRTSLLFASLLIFGCRETSIRGTNNEPTAEIVSPSDAETVLEGYAIPLVGAAGDPDDLNADLTASWLVDGVEVCPGAAPADDGTTVCEAIFTAESNGSVVLQVTDPSGATATDSITVVVELTDAPTAAIVLPTLDGTYYSDLLIEFEGHVADDEDPAEDLTATWATSLGDDLSGLNPVPDSTGTVSGSGSLWCSCAMTSSPSRRLPV